MATMRLGYGRLPAFVLLTAVCGGPGFADAPPASPPTPPAQAFDDSEEQAIRFLEARVKADPDDFIAHNKLAGYYLQRLRETSDPAYLGLADRAARASLATLPAEQNT